MYIHVLTCNILTASHPPLKYIWMEVFTLLTNQKVAAVMIVTVRNLIGSLIRILNYLASLFPLIKQQPGAANETSYT